MKQNPFHLRIAACAAITTLALLSLIPAAARAQGPSRAEVLQAQKYFTDRNLLPQLVSLTREDAAQVTRFSDVIVACHRIYIELDQLEKNLKNNEKSSTTLRTSLDRLQSQIDGIQKAPESAGSAVSESVAVSATGAAAVGDEVVGPVKTRVEKLERILQEMKLGELKSQKSMTQTRWVSFGSAIFAGLVAILAAI